MQLASFIEHDVVDLRNIDMQCVNSLSRRSPRIPEGYYQKEAAQGD